MRREFVRDIRNRKYEQADNGLYLPRHKVLIGGVFEHEVWRNGKLIAPPQRDHNIMTDQGLNSILDINYHGSTQITTWYIGLFKGNYSPVAGDTAAGIASAATEATEYDESTRVEWVEAAASSKSISNNANKATFTINATVTIYGAFLVSSNTKSGTSGTLSAASRFSSSRALVDDDQLLVTYSVTAADA